MSGTQKSKIDMTTGHIMKNIILFAIPIIIGNVLQPEMPSGELPISRPRPTTRHTATSTPPPSCTAASRSAAPAAGTG